MEEEEEEEEEQIILSIDSSLDRDIYRMDDMQPRQIVAKIFNENRYVSKRENTKKEMIEKFRITKVKV